MRTVSAGATLPGTVHEAQKRWFDTDRWPAWVEGLARVIEVAGEWPAAGATVTWESGPAGRGTVTERVLSYEPLADQTVEVQDDSIRGRQTVSFRAVQERVEVALALEYEVRKRSVFTPLIDALFIRGAMERSLRATLTRFAAELMATREPGVG